MEREPFVYIDALLTPMRLVSMVAIENIGQSYVHSSRSVSQMAQPTVILKTHALKCLV